MVYECELCDAALPPGALACPKCGEAFEEPVPQDAVVHKSGWKPKAEKDVGLPVVSSAPGAVNKQYPDYILPDEHHSTSSSKKTHANQHSSYWSFTALGLLLWPVGLIVGIIFLTKSTLLERKLGEHTVVVSILGFVLGCILSALMFGSRPIPSGSALYPSVRSNSSVKTLLSNLHLGPDPNDAIAQRRLKQIGLAMTSYIYDSDEKYPNMDTSSDVQSEIASHGLREDGSKTFVNPETFIDPFSNLPWKFNANFSGLSIEQKIEFASCEIIVYSPQPMPNGMRYCLFADGHWKELSQSKWDAAEATTKIKIDPSLGFSTDYTLVPQ